MEVLQGKEVGEKKVVLLRAICLAVVEALLGALALCFVLYTPWG